MNKFNPLARISIGMLEEEVQAILGRPDRVSRDENGNQWHYARESIVVCFRPNGRRETFKVMKKKVITEGGVEQDEKSNR